MISINLIKKTFLLGITQALPRLPLIACAYLLSTNDYFIFNKYYYSASIVILWGSFGFDIGANISKTKRSVILYAILFNTIICSGIILLPALKETSFLEILSIMVYSASASATGVFLMRLLFQEKIKDYFRITFLSMIMFVGTLLLFKVCGFRIFHFIFPCYSVMLLLFAVKKNSMINKSIYINNSLKELYESGFLSFSINGIVPLVFAIDKYLINQNFETGIANSYVFAWGITSPIFYLGNIVEKYIYSSSGENWKKMGLLGLSMTGLLISAYAAFIVLVINLFPAILPVSIDHEIIKSVTTWMLLGYSLYSIFHFPLNGLLFKYRGTGTQRRVAKGYLIFAVLIILFFIGFKDFILTNYVRLLCFTLLILFFLLLIKVGAIVSERNKEND